MAFTIKGSINSSDKTYLYSEVKHKQDQQNLTNKIIEKEFITGMQTFGNGLL